MTPEEATKVITEMGLDPDEVIVTNVRLRDMFMLNELVDTARAWLVGSIYAGATDCALTARLAASIEEYNAAEKRAQET